jgi:hypothetical protein
MTALTPMDRRSRALWQDAAARKREWYAKPGFMFKRSSSVVADVKFGHGALILFARRGDTFDPHWWS